VLLCLATALLVTHVKLDTILSRPYAYWVQPLFFGLCSAVLVITSDGKRGILFVFGVFLLMMGHTTSMPVTQPMDAPHAVARIVGYVLVVAAIVLHYREVSTERKAATDGVVT
jgi:hypothetical protein